MTYVAIALYLLGCLHANYFVWYASKYNLGLQRDITYWRRKHPKILIAAITIMVLSWWIFTLLGFIRWLLAKEPEKEKIDG